MVLSLETNAGAAATAQEELELRGVCKRYGETPAVSDLSLGVRRGEFLTILGPSGSGKTTLLQIVAGFLFPTSGAVVYRGVDITYMPAHLRNIGMVFQNYALFPHMTVSQNLAFPLQMRHLGKDEIRRRVHEALELVGLARYPHRLPSELSGGQQQRVAVARALIYRPSLLLMDEPLGALDKYLRERLQVEIKRIQRATGVTIVYVTHDQQEALAMSDRIAVMFESRLQALGTPREIYDRPRTKFVAEFIGGCNFLTGRVLNSDDQLSRIEIAEDVTVSVPTGSRALRSGEAATICIRPESIECASAGDDNRTGIPGVVTEIVYLGDQVRYQVALPTRDPKVTLQVKSLRPTRTFGFSCGDEIFVRWNLQDAWLIEEPGDQAMPCSENEGSIRR
jgi:putative spermidine/putrescine transport system ATP-binding protein